MKIHLSFCITTGLIVIVILLAGFGGNELNHSSGADPGYTNSPGDGKNCTHCMGGTAVPVTGWITSDVPVTGYVPGDTYNITVTATGTGNKGFEVSPQDIPGNLIGILTAGPENKLVGTGKYVTHSQASSANPKVWTFQWTAPSVGVGEVTFYGSIAVGKLNTKTTTMSVSQSTVGISRDQLSSFTVFPIPAHEMITINFTLRSPGMVSLELLSSTGRKIMNLMNEPFPAGNSSRSYMVCQPAGIYYLLFNNFDHTQLKKLIIQ